MSAELKMSDLKFQINLKDAFYELDELQQEMLNFYLRADFRFKQAYHTNYTVPFIKWLRTSANLREPVHLSILGKTRSGKSYTAITIAIIHSLLNGRIFNSEYICAEAYEFLEKLKTMPSEKLINSIFLIDESRNAQYGFGSTARKMKLKDVQNIIAINNISTISLTPDRWANEEANYGLRTFGRCFKTKSVRLMLYNLQEGSHGGSLPMGMVYLPIFTELLPKEYAEKLEKEYLEKKNEWVNAERRGEGNALAEIKKKTAEAFCHDEQFLGIKKKKERMTYISQKLGGEWTTKEFEEILNLTELIKQGVNFDGS